MKKLSFKISSFNRFGPVRVNEVIISALCTREELEDLVSDLTSGELKVVDLTLTLGPWSSDASGDSVADAKVIFTALCDTEKLQDMKTKLSREMDSDKNEEEEEEEE